MKNKKLFIYKISTGFLTALLIMSVGMYFFMHDMAMESFTKLGYPTYIIYPLAIAKILGLVVIWTNISERLRRMAYAGFFFNFILAFFAHIMIGDGEFIPSLIAILLLVISYISDAYYKCECTCNQKQ